MIVFQNHVHRFIYICECVEIFKEVRRLLYGCNSQVAGYTTVYCSTESNLDIQLLYTVQQHSALVGIIAWTGCCTVVLLYCCTVVLLYTVLYRTCGEHLNSVHSRDRPWPYSMCTQLCTHLYMTVSTQSLILTDLTVADRHKCITI